MRPKTPVAPGKKVRCPKCETVFVAEEDLDEVEEVKPTKKKAPAKAIPAPPKPKPKEEPKPAKKDEDIETYGYIKDADDEDEEVQERKRVNYAPDESIRDMRGPAIVKLREPASYLTLCGFIGAGGWLLFILLMTIPFSFPIIEDKKPEGERPAAAEPGKPAKGPEKSTFHIWWSFDFYNGVINRWNNPASFWAIIFGFLMLALYSGLISFGAIKLVNMESRIWGIAAGILALLPINVGGITFAIAFGIQFGLRQVEIDEDSINYLTIGIGVLLWFASLGLGVWTLIVANDAVVLEGYEYEPE